MISPCRYITVILLHVTVKMAFLSSFYYIDETKVLNLYHHGTTCAAEIQNDITLPWFHLSWLQALVLQTWGSPCVPWYIPIPESVTARLSCIPFLFGHLSLQTTFLLLSWATPDIHSTLDVYAIPNALSRYQECLVQCDLGQEPLAASHL